MRCKVGLNLFKSGYLNRTLQRANVTLNQIHTSRLCNVPELQKSQKAALDEKSTDLDDYTEVPEYPTNIPSLYDDGPERIAHGRQLLREIIRDLPTVEEKIDFVNPYERPWVDVEIRRHRMWLPALIDTRKAYPLSPVPQGYDSLKLYKYVTNTHTLKGLPNCYDSIEITEDQRSRLKIGFCQVLKDELKGRSALSKSIDYFLPQLADLILTTFAKDCTHFKDYQVSNMVRYESFIERGGFKHLYNDKTEDDDGRIQCDTVYKLGELAFSFRDRANVQIRSPLSLPLFVNPDDPICTSTVEDFKYYPASYVTEPDPNPLWMAPGFEYGDPCDFGNLMINSTKNCREVVQKIWKAEPDELNECLLSMAISSCFSWLNGQAHFRGFNQYNDILYPLATQAIFSDGLSWYFACYQLNTLDLLTNFQFEKYPNISSKLPRKSNLCWFDGPYNLYESYDPETDEFANFDLTVLDKILKFFLLQPIERPDIQEPAPYVRKVAQIDNTEADLIEKRVQEQQDIKYTI